jgi:glycosidase
VLEFYKQVLKLRHTSKALLDGGYTAINENDPNVLAYLRVYNDQVVLVALNMSGSEQKANVQLGHNGFTSAKNLIATPRSSAKGDVVTLEPFGVFIAQLLK